MALSSPRWPTLIRALVIAAILASTSASTYFLMREEVPGDVVTRFQALAKPAAAQRPEWGPRIGSLAIARAIYTKDKEQLAENVALLYAAGFLLAGLVYVAISARAAPFMALGTFAAIYYCNTPLPEGTWCPWDVPVLVLSSAGLLLALRRQVWPLALLAIASVAFKETLLLMALFILFYEGRSWRFRLSWVGGAMLAGLLLRYGIEQVLYRAIDHAAFLHQKGDPDNELRVLRNLHTLVSSNPNSLWFANAGLWLLTLIMPAQDRVLAGVRWIGLAFYAGLLFAGHFKEFRIFLEILPGALLLAHGVIDARAPEAPPLRPHAQTS